MTVINALGDGEELLFTSGDSVVSSISSVLEEKLCSGISILSGLMCLLISH